MESYPNRFQSSPLILSPEKTLDPHPSPNQRLPNHPYDHHQRPRFSHHILRPQLIPAVPVAAAALQRSRAGGRPRQWHHEGHYRHFAARYFPVVITS
uniref:Uncharacterized protein n=1 Tax=Rhizophora mucronata TaxID=61149 RepID=A0A2P2J628_RHIMU